MMKKSILVVEDDKALLPMITYNLEKNGYNVNEASTGDQALLSLKEHVPNLILLDWMIPSPNGLQICRIVRTNKKIKNIPIILITAKGEDDDKVVGLNNGADDYITKPFSPKELVARINALLRRTHNAYKEDVLKFEDIEINLNKHRVFRNQVQIHLGPTEYKLLQLLMENPGRVFSREQLLDLVWGHGIFVELRTVDTHIRRIRKAINIKGCVDLIRTVRSAGYSLDK